MVIHDDADGATITKETVAALTECARMIGKIGPTFTDQQLQEMREALDLLQRTLSRKRGVNDASRS